MTEEKTKRIRRIGIRHIGLAAAAAGVLVVMGGSLALALGALGDEQPLPRRAPLAAVGGGGAGAPAAAVAAIASYTPTPEPGLAGTANAGPDSAPPDVAVGGDRPLGPLPPSSAPGIPENVNASPSFLALKDTLAQEIAAYAARVGGIDVGIAVTDLQTGETISVDGNAAHRTGCTINLFALLATVGEFEAGRANPASVASSIRVGIGGSYPPQVRRFLEVVFPSYQAGVDRAQELMSSWGMVASRFYQVPYYQVGTQINQLTALETNLVLGKLYRGEIFDEKWTTYTLTKLREINAGLNYMLPGRLPAAASVAHKIGFYSDRDGWVNNDAGIVTFTGSDGQQKAYAITYLSEKARTEYTGYSFGARLSRLAWDWFAEKYRPAAPPASPTTPLPLAASAPPEATPSQPEATPSPTLEPTPAPTPEVTPPPTPVATPIPTPEPTPSPTPGPTPSPTPAATPSPTPEATPSSTPEPSPTSPPTPAP